MKRTITILAGLCLLLASCDDSLFRTEHHKNAHIGGYIGVVDLKSSSLRGLDGYANISEVFTETHPDYEYFVKKYIFSNWGSNGPSGQAQFWKESISDWMSEKKPGDGDEWVEVPFTKDIAVENGRMYLVGISWQQPWYGRKWMIHSASSKEIVLVDEADKYFFKITNEGEIMAESGYDYDDSSHH